MIDYYPYPIFLSQGGNKRGFYFGNYLVVPSPFGKPPMGLFPKTGEPGQLKSSSTTTFSMKTPLAVACVLHRMDWAKNKGKGGGSLWLSVSCS